MCGIAGKISFNKKIIRLSDLKPMSKAIEHRGPDDEGFYITRNKKVGLVNRRLAIIDLSKRGHQPMVYKGKYFITFNGEIYNFQELKIKLKKSGYRFKSGTDTEVILALYDKYGVNCLKHLRGMFAFAIYDSVKGSVFLARDRIGKKPLKYFINSEVFIFASELKAIITQKEVTKTPDHIAIHHFLTFGYVPSPRTGFRNIWKLEPGHYLIVDLKKASVKKTRYWKLDYNRKLKLSEKQWCDEIISTVQESTKLRMISDVPLGAFLSGGVDSGLIVALMANLSNKPIKTFSIGFKEKKYNETPHAKRIAKLYKTDHTTIIAEPKSIEILPKLVYQYEEPYADASSTVTYMVSKLAKKYVTVILNGDGGDENFAGYDRYYRAKRDSMVNNYLLFIRAIGIPLSSFLVQNRVKKFLEKSKLPLQHRFATYNSYFLNEHKDTLYTEQFKNLTNGINSYDILNRHYFDADAKEATDAALFSDINMYLPDDLLVKVDIASMANSLEGRSPLLDHNVVELAAKIPYSLKVKGPQLKYILKKAAERLIPKENLYRPKMGFSVPLDKWFNGDLNKYTRSVLLSKSAKTSAFFNIDEIRRMLQNHSEKNDFGPRLWTLLTLEMWMQIFFN